MSDSERLPQFDAEQALVNRLSPGYKGLDENGDETTAHGPSMRAYYEGWNNALDECAKRVRAYYREQVQNGIILSPEASAKFIELLQNPPAPNEALKELFRKHGGQVTQ